MFVIFVFPTFVSNEVLGTPGWFWPLGEDYTEEELGIVVCTEADASSNNKGDTY